MIGHGWYGVDFDGTLAHYEGGTFPAAGAAIEPMCALVRKLLAEGKDVRIVTARAGQPVMPDYVVPVVEFCIREFGMPLPVTDAKDFQMIALYDDRAVQIVTNEGTSVLEAAIEHVARMHGEAAAAALVDHLGMGPS